MNIARLKNRIQPYPWGSPTEIPRLLGTHNPAGRPQAELWIGAHPKAPSMVATDSGWMPLDDLIRQRPEEVLGARVSRAFEGSLPFLFKVLAAAAPLSIQAHPGRGQAREGFERENRNGLAFDAPERNYRDPHSKPECICALTPFWAMCGFRPPQTILDHLRMFCGCELKEEISVFAGQCHSEGVRHLIGSLLRLNSERRRKALNEALAHIAAGRPDETFAWIPILARHYPGDIGALAPVWMNVLRLEPGQALFLPEGVLHSYLEGTGIEIMANSDNVIRGGLTSKHIDVAELLKVVNFETHAVERVRTQKRTVAETLYLTPAAEFALSVIELKNGDWFQSGSARNVEILLCIEGRAIAQEMAPGDRRLTIQRGDSVLVPAAAPAYQLIGPATLYRATAP